MADLPPATTRSKGHAEHDPELIAALLDRDLPDADRAFAEARIAACTACAALHADIRALAKENLDLPPLARPRDFSLTPDIAAALARGRVGEPLPVGARLTGEMTVSHSKHTAHDRLLIANLVDRSVSESERARAEGQMAVCHDCALLYDDLLALSVATRAMPMPSRPRDFTLSPADVDRLRVRGWRRVLAAIGSSKDVFSRPLAVGLTTLGLAGLLVATPGALTDLGGSPTNLSTVENATGDAAGSAGSNPEILGQASAAPSAQAESAPAAAAAAPSPAASSAAAPVPAASAGADTERQERDNLFVGGESSPLAGEPDGRAGFDVYGKSLSAGELFGPSAMILVAGLLLLAGLGLFALRWAARRLGDG